jgi:hypothetical protein
MQPDTSAGAPLSPTIVFENLQAFPKTFALKAAIELDVFRAVGEGPGDVASTARHAKASERGIRILCHFLVINGLLSEGRWTFQAHAIKRSVPRSQLVLVFGVDRRFPVASGAAPAV